MAANSASVEYSIDDRPLAFRSPSPLASSWSSNSSSALDSEMTQSVHHNDEHKSPEQLVTPVLSHSSSIAPHTHVSTLASPLHRAQGLAASVHTVLNHHNGTNSHSHVKPSS